MDENEIVGSLQDLGFTEYQSRTYLAAVKLGSCQPKELSEESGVPQSRIYDVMADLRGMGLVEVREASRGKTVIASPPEVTLEALKERRVAELSDAIHSVTSGLEQLHQHEQPQSSFVTMVGHRNTALRHVRKVVSSSDWWLSLALPVDVYREVESEIEEALERGVNVRIVLPDGEETPVQAIAFPPGLRVRQRQLADVLAIADRQYGVFSSLTVTEESPPYVVVRDENLVFLLQNFFEHFWPVSTEIQAVSAFPRRYLDPWRTIKDLKTDLDSGTEFGVRVSGYHNHQERRGQWEGTIVDYELFGPVEADYTVALPTKANLFVEIDDEVTGVGGKRAARMGLAADGLEVVSASSPPKRQ